MITSNRPKKTYKVIYTNLLTDETFTIFVESESSYEAGEAVLLNVGEDTHDLVMAIAVKPNELN